VLEAPEAPEAPEVVEGRGALLVTMGLPVRLAIREVLAVLAKVAPAGQQAPAALPETPEIKV
jgi:hypothetical protein